MQLYIMLGQIEVMQILSDFPGIVRKASGFRLGGIQFGQEMAMRMVLYGLISAD